MTEFGDEWFIDPLSHLVDFINAEAGIASFEIWPVEYLIGCIADRLKLAAYLKEHPEVRDEEIDVAGIILSGRGGSTLLQRLMSTSQKLTSARYWELITPVPLADETPGDPSRRIELGRLNVLRHREIWPEFQAVHPMDHTAFDEELLLMDRTFVSQMYPSYFVMSGYNSWERSFDQTRVYEDLRLWLQLLQHQAPERKGRRWQLKSVQHLIGGALRTVLRAFPEAKAIMTHRRVDDVIPSWCSAQAILLRASQSANFDRRELGRLVLSVYAEGIKDFMDLHEEMPERFIDVRYRDLAADPIGQFCRVLEEMGMTVSEADRRASSEWMARNGRDTHPPHRYSPEEWGLTRQQIEDAFADYHASYVR